MFDEDAPGLTGNLDLICAAAPDRGTFLARQAFALPIHLSKAYWDGGTLLVNVINPTAGIFGGDRITTRVVVQSGARVLLSSPSAARFHSSRGRESRLEQTFEVCAQGSLDVLPEIAIPQRHSRSFQRTIIRVEAGGELIYLESLAPGRVAFGETFAFEHYAWSTDVSVGEQLVHRERARITPKDSSMAGLTSLYPASYYAGLVLISPLAEQWNADFSIAVAQVGAALPAKVAASRLTRHGWSIRILAGDSLALQEAIAEVRSLIYARLGRNPPNPRKNSLARSVSQPAHLAAAS